MPPWYGIIPSVNTRLLVIKIGNSNVTVGVFEGTELLARWRAHTDTSQTADEYGLLLDDFFALGNLPSPVNGSKEAGWRGAILVSVVPPLTTTFQSVCRNHFGIEPLVVGPKVKTGMPIRYENPRTLGADRLVAAVAAKASYGAPVLVIDFGTATTFNAVNREGEFVGGAITPGLHLAADALYRWTAQLPRIDLAMPPHAIATNTTQAIQSGIVLGYVGMLEGMVARMRAELGEPHAPVIATGGLSGLVAPQAGVVDRVDPDLILHGLRMIFDMNMGQS